MNRKHTKETKLKLSEIRKKFLQENPDKHPWKNNNKFKSTPCEKLKTFLKERNISFIEEFTPNNIERNFSIDVAFPDKLIGIEINGNQHYNRDGTLKPYYQERQTLLERTGWKIYQLHYSICFHLEEFSTLLETILKSDVKIIFDYFSYKPKEKKIKISELNPNWRKTPRPERRKVVRPTKEELEKLIWQKPSTTITRELGLKSDTNISRWCKQYGISKPPRGYWTKLKSKNGENDGS